MRGLSSRATDVAADAIDVDVGVAVTLPVRVSVDSILRESNARRDPAHLDRSLSYCV